MNYDENGPDYSHDNGHDEDNRHEEEAAYRAATATPAAAATERKPQLPIMQTCEDCAGDGCVWLRRTDGQDQPGPNCPTCGGSGKVAA